MNHEQADYLRKYTKEQYIYAEWLLTHGFSVRSVARSTRMSEATVFKISNGDYMYDLDMHMNYEEEDE